MSWLKHNLFALLLIALPFQAQAAVVWEENFDDASIDQKGATDSVIDMAGISKWGIDVSNASLTANSDWFRVQTQRFEGRDLDGEAIWESENIDISNIANVSFSLDASEVGTLEGSGAAANIDYYDVFYSVDNGANYTLITNWNGLGTATHTLFDDWTTTNISQTIPAGSTSLKIKVLMKNAAGNEYMQLDNVIVTGDPDTDNDGVIDSLDLDDDNDGILDVVECPGSFTDFQNGSFELPTISSLWSPVLASSVPGWQTDGPSNRIEIWTSGAVSNVVSADGGFHVELQYTQYSNVYQVINTVPGAVLTWSGYHRGRHGTDVAEVRIGSSLADAAMHTEQIMSDGQSWGQYTGTYTVPAGQTTTYFVLTPISNATPSNPSAGNLIDGWTITSNKLCDTDSDGIPDLLDLDSDGDNCKDTDESYGAVGIDTNGDGTWGGVIGASEVDANGLVIAAGVTGASYDTTPAQTAGGNNTFQQAVTVAVDTSPVNQAEQLGGTATYTAVASATISPVTVPLTTAISDVNYQWQISTDGGTTFSNIVGESGTVSSGDTVSYTTPTLVAGDAGNRYKVVFNNEAKLCPVVSNQAILNVNSPPIAVDDAGSTPEDTTLTVTFATGLLSSDTDPDGDSITITQFIITGVTGIHSPGDTVTIPAIGSLKINAIGSYEFIPVANYHGTVPTAIYTISDGQGGTDSADLNITVVSVDDFPMAVNDTITGINEDSGANIINVLAGDSFGGDGPNAGSIALPSATSTNGGTVTIDNNSTPNDPTDDKVIYTPAANFNGTDTFNYAISDNDGDVSIATVIITVVSVDDFPMAVNDTITGINEDSGVNIINVLAGDSFGGDGANTGAIALPSATSANGGTVSVNNNSTPNDPTDDKITYTPAANFNGSDTFDYTITDSDGDTSTATVTITVASVNDLPIAVNDTGTTAEDTTLTVATSNGLIQNNDTDIDGDTLIIAQFTIAGVAGTHNAGTSVIIPHVGNLTINTDGSYIFNPVANYHGIVPTVTYTIIDGSSGSDTATLVITVNSVNDQPTAVNDTITGINEDSGANTIDVLAGDDFGGDGANTGAITLPNTTSTNGGTVTVDNNGTPNDPTDDKVIYTPALDFNGTDTFDYTITDSDGDTSTATVTITVNAVNDPPIADDEILSAVAGVSITIDVLDGDTDPNSDNLMITDIDGTPITNNGAPVTLADGTTVELVNGQLVITPATGVTSVNFSYTIDDGNGGMDQGQVSITITAPPVQQAIPTLSEWALLLLMLMLGVIGYRQKPVRKRLKTKY